MAKPFANAVTPVGRFASKGECPAQSVINDRPRDEAGRSAAPEKRWVGRSFSRAASTYDRVAVLQREIGEHLLAQLGSLPAQPRAMLDLGVGTGHCAARLAQVFPGAQLIAVDIAEGMLRTLHGRPSLNGRVLPICGDGECLPLRDLSVDLVVSNLALQWCSELSTAMAEIRRVLRPGGRFLFSSFGVGTLCELREAWAKADAYSHVNNFVSLETVTQILGDLNFGGMTLAAERRILCYPEVELLLRELKSLGAHNITEHRSRHLTGKGTFGKMLEAYRASMPEGRIEASFEVIVGHVAG